MLELPIRLPYNPKLKERVKYLRKNMTEPEKKLWKEFFYDFQKNHSIRVLRQRPIDNFIVDFYIPKLKIVIEIDGDNHFEENQKIYDIERTEKLLGYGLKVVRYTNREIMNNFEGVCHDILQKVS